MFSSGAIAKASFLRVGFLVSLLALSAHFVDATTVASHSRNGVTVWACVTNSGRTVVSTDHFSSGNYDTPNGPSASSSHLHECANANLGEAVAAACCCVGILS